LFRLRLMPSSRPYCPTHPSSSRKRECEMRSAKRLELECFCFTRSLAHVPLRKAKSAVRHCL
jgi:hypothetical protein